MSTEAFQILQSVCPLDCPDTCSLDVKVADGRVVAIDGNHRNAVTAGYICGKVRRFPEHVYGTDRVLYPAVRSGKKGSGTFRRVSWDEALALVVERVRDVKRRLGGEAILPFSYGGSNGYLTQGTTDARLFHRLGASRLAHTVCAAPSSTAVRGLYGRMPGVAFEDYPAARLIVIWGCNPSATGIHLVPYIRRAQRAGAKLVVVDPRRTPLARLADLHMAPLPGTDLPVALAVHRWLFEHGATDKAFLEEHVAGVEEFRRRVEAWTIDRAASTARVKPDEIEQLARMYAESSPAVIRCGWGVERNRNGGSAVAAILALPAVAGKFGVRGGGFTMSNSMAWDLDATRAACEPEPATRLINMNRLGQALVDEREPPIALLFVYNANPLATLPRQGLVRAGLAREDLFTIDFEQVLTDTARWADVLLPATTFLEHTELRKAYGAMLVQSARPVIAPVGEARPNYAVYAELCRRLVLSHPGEPEGPEELADAILSGDSSRPIAASLRDSGTAAPLCGARPVQFVDVLPRTSDGKVHLVPSALDAEAPLGLYGYQHEADDRYTLALISPATSRSISSSLAQLIAEQVAVEIHPDDAAARGIATGDAVRVFNELGQLHTRAELNDQLRHGVAVVPKGLWSRHTADGNTANSLVPDTFTDLGGGACFNDARVEIERI